MLGRKNAMKWKQMTDQASRGGKNSSGNNRGRHQAGFAEDSLATKFLKTRRRKQIVRSPSKSEGGRTGDD